MRNTSADELRKVLNGDDPLIRGKKMNIVKFLDKEDMKAGAKHWIKGVIVGLLIMGILLNLL